MRTLRAASVVAATIVARIATGAGDLTPVEAKVIGRVDGVDQVVLAQTASGGPLKLSPDNCFFAGDRDGLSLAGQGTTPDPLNGNASFARIDGLHGGDQRVVWPLWLHAAGVVTGHVDGTGSGQFTVTLGEQKAQMHGNAFSIEDVKPGRADLVLAAGTFNGSIQRVSLDGPAMAGTQLLRARWRPAAVHCPLRSSTLGDRPICLWVVEIRPVVGEEDFYAPVTTPFGYFGSTFPSDGTIGGINFSMWSFGKGAAEPPLAQLSHLLAVGNPQAKLGGFASEGTGVKVRDWNPFAGRRMPSETLALRIDIGTPYDTYTGYYWDPTTADWHLYAVGRKWSGARRADDLRPGFFIEVPGAPAKQRTGQDVRAADVRGWCRDDAGQWHPLDTMDGGRRDARRGTEVNCTWNTSPDGRMRLSMGGMTHYRYADPVVVHCPESKAVPPYLAPDKLPALDRLPTDVRVDRVTRAGDGVVVDVNLTTAATGPTRMTALYGSADALSFGERWEHTLDLGVVGTGKQAIRIPTAPANGFVRVRAENETGTYVSPRAGTW
jgi:hypothetical protein